MYKEEFLKIAHCFSTENIGLIQRSNQCGCFCCLKVFKSEEVSEWVNDRNGQTAICPHCGIDSVIGDASVMQVDDPAFWLAMKRYWFY